MSVVEEPIRGSNFIDRIVVGGTVLNVLKGLAWGNAVGISQSVGK